MSTHLMTLCNSLAGLSVSGVTKSFTMGSTPPPSINTADLPALLILDVGLGYGPETFGGNSPLHRPTVQQVMLVEPMGQSRPVDTFNTMVGLADAYVTAFAALDQTLNYDVACEIEFTVFTLAGHDYASLFITVTAEV